MTRQNTKSRLVVRKDTPPYPTDRWRLDVQQLHNDAPQLGISVLEDDGVYCRFKCQDVVYTVLWHETYPFDPPLMYREGPGNSTTPIIPSWSPASSMTSIVADIVYTI